FFTPGVLYFWYTAPRERARIYFDPTDHVLWVSAPFEPVRLVLDRAAVHGCQLLRVVRDDDFADLKEKARRIGGDIALITRSTWAAGTTAEVYRCEPKASE